MTEQNKQTWINMNKFKKQKQTRIIKNKQEWRTLQSWTTNKSKKTNMNELKNKQTHLGRLQPVGKITFDAKIFGFPIQRKVFDTYKSRLECFKRKYLSE